MQIFNMIACIYCFVINFSKIWMIGILYNAIMHNLEFDQTYCKDLLKEILWRFILHFCDIYSIFYKLLKFNEFLEIENEKRNWKKV
jgi:hypothetical protein